MGTVDYNIRGDLKLIREILTMSQEEMAASIGVATVTWNRWEKRVSEISAENTEKIYSFAYTSGIYLNRIKEQFHREEIGAGDTLLFHGAKSVIDGSIRVDVARASNDFGRGFYVGESFRQAALFISNFSASSVYILSFDTQGMDKAVFHVDRDWLLTIAAYRGRLRNHVDDQVIRRIRDAVSTVDYIIAPIADNRMYQIIDSFIDGEITDEQCIHALAATDLGMQYVIRSKRAADRLKILERCYLCAEERGQYITNRNEDLRVSEDKVRAARIKYRGKGKYIDELL